MFIKIIFSSKIFTISVTNSILTYKYFIADDKGAVTMKWQRAQVKLDKIYIRSVLKRFIFQCRYCEKYGFSIEADCVADYMSRKVLISLPT